MQFTLGMKDEEDLSCVELYSRTHRGGSIVSGLRFCIMLIMCFGELHGHVAEMRFGVTGVEEPPFPTVFPPDQPVFLAEFAGS